jgi:hypothetical protein
MCPHGLLQGQLHPYSRNIIRVTESRKLVIEKVIRTDYLEDQDVDGIVILILNHKETGYDCMELISLILDRDQRRANVNTDMNLRVIQKMGTS